MRRNPALDIRADFPHADTVDAFTAFNISGNKYRLISLIKYRWRMVLREALPESGRFLNQVAIVSAAGSGQSPEPPKRALNFAYTATIADGPRHLAVSNNR